MRALPVLFVAALLALPASFAGVAAERSPPTSPARAPAASPHRAVPRPVFFVENRGQTDARVALHASTRAGTVWFTGQGLTYGFVREGERWAVKLEFVGARQDVAPQGRSPAPTVVSYLRGARDAWRAGLPTFREVVYRDLWPGIDLVYEAKDGGLKYTFEVAAGADPSAIAFDVRGATECALDAERRLRVATPMGGFVDDRPVAWQETQEGRRPVDAAFAVAKSRVRFDVGAYDASLPLTIDPPTYVYAGYLGGAGTEFAGGIAVDSQGNAYITGRTASDETTFPVEAGYDMDYGGAGFESEDAFVAKVSPAGDDLLYVTYLGGTGFEMATGIRVTADGSAVVCGFTGSKDDFPLLVGPDLTWGGGAYDGFVTKLSPAGTGLAWSGLIGGLSDPFGWDDVPASLELDETGRVYLVGTTTSTQATFPTAGGHLDATHNGGSDVYVVVVAADGGGFVEAGYLGGPGSDTATDIAVGADHGITICGQTTDGGAGFPKLVGPDLTYGGGTQDGFVARLDSSATLQWCGFWGGALTDSVRGVDVDDAGNAYLVGITGSSEASFPVVNATFAVKGGSSDACFAKVKADGTAFLVSSYLGGAAADEGNDVQVSDDGGTLYLCGTTSSSQATFPAGDGSGSLSADFFTFHGQQDPFLAVCDLDDAGEAFEPVLVLYLFGDTAREEGEEICVDEHGDVYFVGHQFPDGDGTAVAVVGPGLTSSGAEEAFVGKLDLPEASDNFYQLIFDSFGPPKHQRVDAKGFLHLPPGTALGDQMHLRIGGFDATLQRQVGFPGEITYYADLGDGKRRVVRIKPSPDSSRAGVTMSIDGVAVTDFDANGTLPLSVESGSYKAQTSIETEDGRYESLVDPVVAVTKASATVPGAPPGAKAALTGKDSLTVTCRFATSGTRPEVAPPFTCRFGGQFDVTIPAGAMKPKGKHVFTGQAGTAKVVLDFKKGVGTFTAKKVALGTFAPGANAVGVGVTVGADSASLDLTMRLRKKKLSW